MSYITYIFYILLVTDFNLIELKTIVYTWMTLNFDDIDDFSVFWWKKPIDKWLK